MLNQFFRKKTIIWDWNGTLLNDLDICLQGINILLANRDLPLLDKSRYSQIFTFPVRDYYEKAGFDFSKEPFEIPAEQFIVHYKKLLPQASLFHDVVEVLDHFKMLGFKQFILSAMEQNALLDSVEKRGILPYFDGICGINDNLAHSKLDNARELLASQKLEPADAIMIGDTLHDAEVSNELGINAILIGRGHQSTQRLEKTGLPVFQTLKQVKEIITLA